MIQRKAIVGFLIHRLTPVRGIHESFRISLEEIFPQAARFRDPTIFHGTIFAHLLTFVTEFEGQNRIHDSRAFASLSLKKVRKKHEVR